MEMDEAFCPLYHHAVELIGRRWSAAIVRALMAGCTRFGQIREVVPALSDTMLAARLRELEDEGIVARQVSADRPPQVSYALTAKGAALKPAVVALTEWAERWVDPADVGRTRSTARTGSAARAASGARPPVTGARRRHG